MYMGACQEIPVTPKAAINSFTQMMKFALQHLTKIHPSGRMMASAVLSREESDLESKRIWHQIWKDFCVTIHWERPAWQQCCPRTVNANIDESKLRHGITFVCLILFIASITAFIFYRVSRCSSIYHFLRFGGKSHSPMSFFWGPETDWPPFPKGDHSSNEVLAVTNEYNSGCSTWKTNGDIIQQHPHDRAWSRHVQRFAVGHHCTWIRSHGL